MESSSAKSYYETKAESAAQADNLRPPDDITEFNGQAVVPFEGRTPNKHFYDTKPGGNAYDAIDVCGARESLIKNVTPLELVDCSRVGEYTPLKWQNHHQEIAVKCQRMLTESDRLRQDCRQKSFQIRTTTETMQKESTKGLDIRVRKTLDNKELLLLQIQKATQELNLLRQMKKRLQSAMYAIELPENNNKECFHIRQFRLTVDNTRDGVSYALNKESETLRTGRNLLTESFNEIQEAISRLSEIKRILEHDWSDKQEAMQIDHFAAKLQFKPNLAQFKPVSAALNEGASTPVSWQDRIDLHVTANERDIVNDTQLRGAADHALREVSADVLCEYENVDVALNVSIGRIESALATLKEEDGQIRHEIANQEMSIKSLRQELEDKESPLQVAQTRHYSRSFRPGNDRCLDEPHYSLKSELEELPKSISTLRLAVSHSEECLEDLHRQHEDLLQNIVGREHSLSLDTRCVTVRKMKPFSGDLQGF